MSYRSENEPRNNGSPRHQLPLSRRTLDLRTMLAGPIQAAVDRAELAGVKLQLFNEDVWIAFCQGVKKADDAVILEFLTHHFRREVRGRMEPDVKKIAQVLGIDRSGFSRILQNNLLTKPTRNRILEQFANQLSLPNDEQVSYAGGFAEALTEIRRRYLHTPPTGELSNEHFQCLLGWYEAGGGRLPMETVSVKQIEALGRRIIDGVRRIPYLQQRDWPSEDPLTPFLLAREWQDALFLGLYVIPEQLQEVSP